MANIAEIMSAYDETGSYYGAAKKLGLDISNTRKKIVKELAKRKTYTSEKAEPDLEIEVNTDESVELSALDAVKAKSTLYKVDDENGTRKKVLEWVKTTREQRGLIDLTNALVEIADGKAKRIDVTRISAVENSAFELVVSDAHIGMLSWKPETGYNYDTDTATSVIDVTVCGLLGMLKHKKYKQGYIVFLGDTMHADNRSAVTEKSGHRLDVDTRYQRLIDSTAMCITSSIEQAAKYCELLTVVIVPGNHDWHSSVCMSRILRAYFKNSTNINVDVTASPRIAHKFGKNMIVHTHGDGVSAQKIQQIVSTEFPKMWGETEYRYAHLGHIHHSKKISPACVEGVSGLTVEYLPALCPPDAYAVTAGYVGNQPGAQMYTYSHDYGITSQLFYPLTKAMKEVDSLRLS